jgi:hypothetical protein
MRLLRGNTNTKPAAMKQESCLVRTCRQQESRMITTAEAFTTKVGEIDGSTQTAGYGQAGTLCHLGSKKKTRAISRYAGSVMATSLNLLGESPGSSFQFFPFLPSCFLAPWLLLLGGGFSPFGATTTVFGGLGGRSSLFCAKAPAARKQPIATAISFCLKSNIEFPVLLMHYRTRMGGRVRDAPRLIEQERCQER